MALALVEDGALDESTHDVSFPELEHGRVWRLLPAAERSQAGHDDATGAARCALLWAGLAAKPRDMWNPLG